MSLAIRLAVLAALSTAAGFAGIWSGPLVDSKCYGAEQRNVNPTDTETFVDRDMSYGIRYCSPTHKTKLFAIVAQDGQTLKFDSAGNAKAAELVRNVNKKHVLDVAVSGEMTGKEIRVDSISETPQR
jgi:hypothetical protein